jgi:hypothetical protein
MAIYEKNSTIQWNFKNIQFVHAPEIFTGTFQNAKMEARNKTLLEKKKSELLHQIEHSDDPYEAMLTLHKNDHIQFLLNNIDIFKNQGCYEKAVLMLYYLKNTSFVIFGKYSTWKMLFQQCDTQRLYGQGKPFPHQTITAYRGSATGEPKGLSWTINTKEVEWFLDRWQDKDLGGGTIFALDITREDVMHYREDEQRQEIILLPEVAESKNIRTVDFL